MNCPILDGSSQPFIDLLAQAGTRRLRRQRRYLRVVKPLEFADGNRRIGIYPDSEFRVHCFADYGHPAIGPQQVEMSVNRESFINELAPARTFGFVKDFAQLQEMGLIRGGSLANALVLDDTSLLNPPLRFPDEYGRHKALDLIGDLALVGRPLQARIVAHKARVIRFIRSLSPASSKIVRSGRKPPSAPQHPAAPAHSAAVSA